MSKRLFSRTGGADQNEQWEARLQQLARNFAYPPTPDLADIVKERLAGQEPKLRPGFLFGGGVSRQVAWVAIGLLLVLAGLLAVPQVRAALVEFLQIGAVRIFLVEPTPTATSLPVTSTPGATATSTPRPSPTPLSSLLDLAGETTLAEAQEKAGFPIRWPSYPAALGAPDRVFFQDLGGPAVVLVWLESGQPERVRLSLHLLGPNTFAEKGSVGSVQETTVNGQRAVWTEGPYMLQYRRGNQVDYDVRRLVEGHVLLWYEGEITYRLETDLPLEEAVRVAESLR